MTTTSVASLAAQPLATVVARLNRSRVPILFVDTCALLDIVRAPCRGRTKELLSAQRLEAALKAKRAALCAAEITLDEWNRNIGAVVDEVEAAERKANETVNAFVLAARLVGNPTASRADLSQLHVPAKLREWSERMLGHASLVTPTRAVQSATWERQANNLAPSKRGKDSHGDCTIVETLLAVGGERTPTAGRLVFLTSNTKDFANNGTLHSDLEPEFKRVNATATFHWEWALNELGV